MRVKIMITVDYDEAVVTDKNRLRRYVEQEVFDQIQEGMLTPTLEEVVDDYSLSVTVEDANAD